MTSTEQTPQRHPNCVLCQQGEPSHPFEGDPKFPSGYIERFEPSQGLRYGWNVDCTFHGRYTRTPIIQAQFILQGICYGDCTSMLAIHCVSYPCDWQQYDDSHILGSVEQMEDSRNDARIKPGLWVGHFIVLADRNGTQSVIELPLAHLYQHYTWGNPD